MRLSEVLSKAPDTSSAQVEGFLGSRRVAWGQHRSIDAGMIIRNYFCHNCEEIRTFLSGKTLSCLITGENTLSIDAALRCAACGAQVDAWFLVECEGDLFSQAPMVHLERYTENRRGAMGEGSPGGEQIADLFERAQVAYDNHLGAGAMIYLRKIFEMVTSQAATSIGISTVQQNGKRRTFRDLLEEVDEDRHIIPAEFSKNGYRLFSELSEVIHGDSDETVALSKYVPCRELVRGVISNIRNNQAMAQATASLGWDASVPGSAVEGGVS